MFLLDSNDDRPNFSLENSEDDNRKFTENWISTRTRLFKRDQETDNMRPVYSKHLKKTISGSSLSSGRSFENETTDPTCCVCMDSI